jgi:hypothetical protein
MSLAGVPPPATAEAASIAVAPSAPPAAGVDGVDVQMTSTEDDAAAEQAKSDAELIRRTEEEKIAKEEKEKAEWTETLYIQVRRKHERRRRGRDRPRPRLSLFFLSLSLYLSSKVRRT